MRFWEQGVAGVAGIIAGFNFLDNIVDA